MSEQPQDQNAIEIPNWIVNQIGRLNLEIEVLRNENNALRAALNGQPVPAIDEDADTDSE